MTQQTDISSLIETWLVDDEPDVLPNRALEAVADRLQHVRQHTRFLAFATSWRFAAIAASLTAVAATSLVVFGIMRPSPPVPPGSPTPTSHAPQSASPTPIATPSQSATPFVSTQLGFQAMKPIDDANPWANFLYAPIANGTAITFPDGRFIGADIWSDFIVVSSGTRRDGGAVVGTSFPPVPKGETPPPDPDWDHASLIRIWDDDVDGLAADYVKAVGGEVGGEQVIDGERGIIIYDSDSMPEVVVVVHGRRAFVIGSTSFFSSSTGAPSWDRFLASFRFLD